MGQSGFFMDLGCQGGRTWNHFLDTWAIFRGIEITNDLLSGFGDLLVSSGSEKVPKRKPGDDIRHRVCCMLKSFKSMRVVHF